MAIRRDTSDPDRLLLTFELPVDEPPGPVSVVGSFNDWTPGVHELVDAGDGTRRAHIEVGYGRAVHFRYLGAAGAWFDEPDADEVTAMGSLLNPVAAPEPVAPARSGRRR
jgi:hypothetical protein